MGYELAGKSWDEDGFVSFIEKEQKHMNWVNGVTLHHTGWPNLEMRPQGMTDQHVKNTRHYYEKEKKWKAGPHLFVDDRRIMGMSSLRQPGTHAISFNRTHVGIEILGDYDHDNPAQGRGLECWNRGIFAACVILHHLGLDHEDVTFHRDCVETDKSCPGKGISRGWVEILLKRQLAQMEEPQVVEAGDTFNPEVVEQALFAIEWQMKKIRKEMRKR